MDMSMKGENECTFLIFEAGGQFGFQIPSA